MLRLVDDQNRASPNGHQRQQELVQRADQLVRGRLRDAPTAHALARYDAEVEQYFAQQFLDRKKRVEDDGGEDARLQLFEQRAAARRLPGADVTRENDEAVLAADCLLQQRKGFAVRFAAI